jgi:hypothetical protein
MNFTSESRNNSERNTPRANAKNGWNNLWIEVYSEDDSLNIDLP